MFKASAGDFFLPADEVLTPGSSGTANGWYLATTLCFLAGTLILTASGSAAVETLQIGDPVVVDAATGRTAPVKFVFTRRIVPSPFLRKDTVLPICISRGALGENQPTRDLYLSPEHAVMVGDILVQAAALINGDTIDQVQAMPQAFSYYHIEFEDHALVIAEGMPSETYVDNAGRESFDNYAEYLDLYGEPVEMSEIPYLRAKSSRQLPKALRDRLGIDRRRRLDLAAV